MGLAKWIIDDTHVLLPVFSSVSSIASGSTCSLGISLSASFFSGSFSVASVAVISSVVGLGLADSSDTASVEGAAGASDCSASGSYDRNVIRT